MQQARQVAVLSRLTERELEAFRVLAQGLTNAEIAARLYMGKAATEDGRRGD